MVLPARNFKVVKADRKQPVIVDPKGTQGGTVKHLSNRWVAAVWFCDYYRLYNTFCYY